MPLVLIFLDDEEDVSPVLPKLTLPSLQNDQLSDNLFKVLFDFSDIGITFAKDAIKANLINYFLTNKGERFLNPEFGSNIRRLLFENITEENLAEIEAVVADDLEKYFPRVKPTVIQLASNPDTNTIVFFLRYAIVDTNIEDELIINFDE